MVHILGVQLFEANFVKHALTQFYGISHHTASRICARLQIHDTCRVRHLSATQITSIAAFLSSPATSPIPPRAPLAPITFQPSLPSTPLQNLAGARTYLAQLDAPPPPLPRVKTKGMDPLRWLRIETDLKNEMRENIAHQRMIGSYVGKRHAMGLPVRGQNTQTNARTAKKLNRVERHR
ncbi:mitochondrial 30S ribosomal protein S13 [Russula ochroleuca]|uniref:Small ribosomal subunit protein uS13m n=1 Tax=Russula ochroleuca TaxID=152965 RepID=A0A9P5T7D9_9AGAM|nr:mitochondrial 30S ribosomal protein S13 [Russula ochroleuca]